VRSMYKESTVFVSSLCLLSQVLILRIGILCN
jgi:hypothetical protein